MHGSRSAASWAKMENGGDLGVCAQAVGLPTCGAAPFARRALSRGASSQPLARSQIRCRRLRRAVSCALRAGFRSRVVGLRSEFRESCHGMHFTADAGCGVVRFQQTRRLTLGRRAVARLAVFVCAVVWITLGLASPARANFGWPPDSDCANPQSAVAQSISTLSGPNCVGGMAMRARGYLNANCLLTPPNPAAPQIYDSPADCGGRGPQHTGVESIAQARAIAYLNEQGGSSPGGISPQVQWEVNIR